MSQLSVEVRAMAEALNSGDLEAFLARTTEDVEFTSLVAEAEGPTFRGHAGVRAWWGTVLGAFQDPRWEVLDVRGSGDRAVVKSRLTATLADTEVTQTMWMAARLREGKLGWRAFYRTEHDALEACGSESRRCRRSTSRLQVGRWLRGAVTLEAIPVEIYTDDVEWDFSALSDLDLPRRSDREMADPRHA